MDPGHVTMQDALWGKDHATTHSTAPDTCCGDNFRGTNRPDPPPEGRSPPPEGPGHHPRCTLAQPAPFSLSCRLLAVYTSDTGTRALTPPTPSLLLPPPPCRRRRRDEGFVCASSIGGYACPGEAQTPRGRQSSQKPVPLVLPIRSHRTRDTPRSSMTSHRPSQAHIRQQNTLASAAR